MPFTTCNQKEFLIESELNGFFEGFLLHLIGLRNFHFHWGRGDEVK